MVSYGKCRGRYMVFGGGFGRAREHGVQSDKRTSVMETMDKGQGNKGPREGQGGDNVERVRVRVRVRVKVKVKVRNGQNRQEEEEGGISVPRTVLSSTAQ
jgi:hypothetical protein